MVNVNKLRKWFKREKKAETERSRIIHPNCRCQIEPISEDDWRKFKTELKIERFEKHLNTIRNAYILMFIAAILMVIALVIGGVE